MDVEIMHDHDLARRCRVAYEVSPEDFGLFEVQTDADESGTVLAFVGSKNVVDWTFNLRFQTVWSDRFGGAMHGGFLDLFERSRLSFETHLRRSWRPGARLTITGHSLGGALATLAAIQVRTLWPLASVDLVTFGAPRIFTFPALGAIGPRSAGRHYTLGVDPVPHLPAWRPWRRYASLPGRVWLARPRTAYDGWPSLWQRAPVLRDHSIYRYEAALATRVRA